MGDQETNTTKNPHGFHDGSFVRAASDQVSCDLAGEAAILDLKSGVYYGLDVVGARIWELLKEEIRVRDLREAILREYEVSPQECQSDLIELLNQLADAGLVNVREPSET